MSENEKDFEKTEKGGISVETEHIFPVIKRWLYSEKEIFLREIVSNACDALTKLKRLSSLGEFKEETGELKVTVTIDKENNTLTVSDNGIGMTSEEVKKYICQIALSGALDFIEKYEGESEGASKNGIIGHFGLGFYSAFMVSDRVDIETKSYTGAKAVEWTCGDAGDYEMREGDRETRGTDVVMHISDSEIEYLTEYKIREILEKYCSFMPFEIYLVNLSASKDDKKENEEQKPINDTHPLWQKNPSDCTEEEYKEFYKKVFADYKEPLFYIHLNADYPLNFKGILFFPEIASEFESLEGQVKLYYNQVFVADNVKEVIPEYLLMLKGVLDCPELPLNVSRSYLQNNTYVSKLSAHIVKKVADKLNSMFANEREKYEKLWLQIKTFVEYASLRDRKFYERIKNSVLLPLTDGKFATVDEYLEKAKEKHENTVYYATDKNSQSQYISLFASENIDSVLFDKVIDASFIGLLEEDKKIKFVRVDADVADALKGDGEKYENEELVKLFREVSKKEKLNVRFEALKNKKLPALLNLSEQTRRIDDMMKYYAMAGKEGVPNTSYAEETLILNTENELIRRLETLDDEKKKIGAKQIYMLSLLSLRSLDPEEMKEFLSDSFDLLEKEL